MPIEDLDDEEGGLWADGRERDSDEPLSGFDKDGEVNLRIIGERQFTSDHVHAAVPEGVL